MDIVEATASYEAWLAQHVELYAPDLKIKHGTMRDSAFGFLRATYYRWVQQFPALCAEAAQAPRMPGIGDLHLENFGTWRDGEARLVWGVNDFDEAATLPYSNDLVRLATSTLIAIGEGSLKTGAKAACREILAGYSETIAAREAKPFVLEEANRVLRDLAMSDRKNPKKFWKKILDGKEAEPPADAKALLLRHLPNGAPDVWFARRTAGAGSLGLPRFVAVRQLDRSNVAREAKRRAPSARSWAGTGKDDPAVHAAVIAHAIRPHDPFLAVEPGWVVRRLAPHCERIEIADIADAGGRREVLHAMGVETANIHRGTRGATAQIRAHLAKQKDGWLHDAAERMAEAVRKDWKMWKKRG
ncbi:MAG: DUF2252 family protein [Rhizomicrobium sp.]